FFTAGLVIGAAAGANFPALKEKFGPLLSGALAGAGAAFGESYSEMAKKVAEKVEAVQDAMAEMKQAGTPSSAPSGAAERAATGSGNVPFPDRSPPSRPESNSSFLEPAAKQGRTERSPGGIPARRSRARDPRCRLLVRSGRSWAPRFVATRAFRNRYESNA